ncbi:hypothetical protein HH212_00555 [Massilia forsythiae]|uniref:Uncharacterized protein n=1 Tax=Massilia forsythiae TaxID=2728020 RepID=A0A7Z2VT60_9BURK|nr:hypothetical protein [Massilia forsythiae]QJD98715.1 hypothetical protein HH212_00555 [Massilia forsythiae]
MPALHEGALAHGWKCRVAIKCCFALSVRVVVMKKLRELFKLFQEDLKASERLIEETRVQRLKFEKLLNERRTIS